MMVGHPVEHGLRPSDCQPKLMTKPDPQAAPQAVTFRTAYCRWCECPEEDFEVRVLAQTLPVTARLLRFFMRPFRPHAFFAEYLLVKQAGDKQSLSDVEIDIDFYKHKYVVGSLARESFRLRVSGRQLLRLARDAFRYARTQHPEIRSAQMTDRPEPA